MGAASIPTIHVDDNFGCWHLGFRELIERVREQTERGRSSLDVLEPDATHRPAS